MNIIRPFDASDISLVSSTVAAADPVALGAWASGTTYALGDIVQVDSPTFTFTASGSTLTATAHGFSDGTLCQVSSTISLPPGLTANMLYYMVHTATNTLKLSATKNGSPIITTGTGSGTHTVTVSTHKLYESLQGSNVGHTPHKSPTWWLDSGATNRWKCFDGSISSQVENTDSLTYVVQLTGRVNYITLFNLNAGNVVITARETGGEAIVYGPVTHQLTSSYGVNDWWDYFFEPIMRAYTLLDQNLPPYNAMQITVQVNDSGATARCGAIIAGLSKTLGSTLFGATLGILDFSIKTQDAFGNWTVQERNFSKRSTFQVMVSSEAVDGMQQLLEQYRATPIVYIGTDLYNSSITYGFYKDFSTNIAYQNYSICSIEVEGLT